MWWQAAWELPWAYGWPAPAVDPTFDRTTGEQGLVNQVHQVLGESGAAEVRKRLVKGNPVEVLLGEAEGAKALVVGSRGMHFYLTTVTEPLLAFRADINAQLGEPGPRISVTDLLVKACATALRTHPQANSSRDSTRRPTPPGTAPASCATAASTSASPSPSKTD
ncbi:2-oxo acid dehydrogenase subunit E2 [Streptomyces sp. B21-105]|uniref:2-oxo acid dehydrogenase subunit E2 n=1 Tax=Streptomyces sp. B21-105 TaxID=3039417 RepID=UPI002FEF45D8